MDLREQVAIVTGGACGIGAALCNSLLKRGVKVSIADVNEDNGRKVADELSKKFNEDSVLYVRSDVTDEQSFRHVFSETLAKFGRIDIVFNNAGIGDEKNWSEMIQLNFKAVVCGTKLALEFMGKDKGGKGGVVVNTASILALYKASVLPVYAGTKAAVAMYTSSMAMPENLAQHGVRMNVLCPSLTQTVILQTALNTSPQPEIWQAAMRGPVMETELVAEAAMELIENEEKNGALLEVVNGKTSYFSLPEIKL